MFTDLLNLPLDRDRASHADQVLSLAGMTWDDYERLTEDDLGYRISFLQGVITILYIRDRVPLTSSQERDRASYCSNRKG